jgi:thymidine kinase
VRNYDVICIDEGQFVDDLQEVCSELADVYNKQIVIAALNGDFNRKIFKSIANIIPHCETITKLDAICHICKNEANFSNLKEKQD